MLKLILKILTLNVTSLYVRQVNKKVGKVIGRWKYYNYFLHVNFFCLDMSLILFYL